MTTAHKSTPALSIVQARAIAWAKNLWKNTVLLKEPSIEGRFTKIYRYNYWGSSESVSGLGSTLEHTENLRQVLPGLFEKFNIHTVFDAPCGDFNWMRLALENCKVKYIGADIVRPLINKLNETSKTARRYFLHLDITKDTYPSADLCICRNTLFHLSYADTLHMLRQFVSSNIPYLLTTTHINEGSFANADICTGDYRLIDLFAAPYGLPSAVLFRVNDCGSSGHPREVCLWTREQIATALPHFERAVSASAAP